MAGIELVDAMDDGRGLEARRLAHLRFQLQQRRSGIERRAHPRADLPSSRGG